MTERKLLGISTHSWGEASVLEVALKMTRLGFRVFKPYVDDGVDLLALHPTENICIRIQVKSSSRTIRNKADRDKPSAPFYEFFLKDVRATSEGISSTTRKFSEEVDFLVLHAVEDDKFLVVPAEWLDNKKTVRYSIGPRSKDLNIENLQKDRESGMTFKEMGEKYGITASAIYERLMGITKAAHKDLSKSLRESEGKWSRFQEFFELARAAG